MPKEEMRSQIKTLLNQLGNKLPIQAKNGIARAMVEVFEKEKTLTEALQMTPKMLNKLYEYGYKLYQGGKYKEAFGCFYFLRELEPFSYRYNFSLAACHQHLKQYTEAAACYIICTNLEPDKPIPYFHLYDCFMKCDDFLISRIVVVRPRSLNFG